MPLLVSDTMNKLLEIVDKSNEEDLITIFKVYEPDPPYLESRLEEQYEKALYCYSDEAMAMENFYNLVILTDEYYEAYIRGETCQ